MPVPIDQLVFSVTLLTTYTSYLSPKNIPLGSGTGFFYKKNDDHFLITNKHIVFDDKKKYYPDLISFKLHTSQTSMLPNRTVTVPLYENNQELWIEHDSDQNIDLVAININQYIQNSDVIFWWSNINFKPDEELITLGLPVIIMGYPLSFHDEYHNLPLCRSGTIASTYGSHFNNNRFFLVDAKLHKGTSGSPVYLPVHYFRETIHGGEVGGPFPPILLGINSGSYTELNLNTIWYADLIEELLS